jgi:hypothetical protein
LVHGGPSDGAAVWGQFATVIATMVKVICRSLVVAVMHILLIAIYQQCLAVKMSLHYSLGKHLTYFAVLLLHFYCSFCITWRRRGLGSAMRRTVAQNPSELVGVSKSIWPLRKLVPTALRTD